MEPIVAGLWGASFGTAALMVAGAVAAFALSLPRVGLVAACVPMLYVPFIVCYLGLWHVGHGHGDQLRLHANMFIAFSAPMGHLVMAMIGDMRTRTVARRRRRALYGFAAGVAAVGWLLSPMQAFVLSTVGAYVVGGIVLALSIRRARRGDRLAGASIAGVLFVCMCTGAMTALALEPSLPWYVHAVASISGIAYLAITAVVLWMRFSYLIELRRVMALGPGYDPITRMRTHSETGQMVGLAFFNRASQAGHVGVLAVTIGNLVALEKLHGRAAANHGLFLVSWRLRRLLPGGLEVGRLGEDAFLVLARAMDDVRDLEKLVQLGHEIVQRLSRPVVLSTSADPGKIETEHAHWVAQVGVGIVLAEATGRPSEAIASARDMSKAAWGYPSRVAWQNHEGRLAEAPQLAPG